MSKDKIKFDPNDLVGMRRLMEKYGNSDSDSTFWGESENGEPVFTSIYPDRIAVVTAQENGWCRINTYHADGAREETFCR
ncbi:MAG: hypothetical protein LUG65_03250 [Clostridiales bacterium]|nr:hypothetical protein [Clostridiales bacterium]